MCNMVSREWKKIFFVKIFNAFTSIIDDNVMLEVSLFYFAGC